ncbi:GspH/FimT family protein [Pseudomonas sp. CGJS7]|uniref:GspH/FimT family protein n=1 Tax=Pseudomonas sp. CGJS7 TaxID=3109348 RepID=UPI00300A7A45
MKHHQGFSSLELLCSLAVLALLVALAVTQTGEALERARIGRVLSTLTESILVSNRAAVGSGATSVLCPVGADGLCNDASDWSGGWIAFADHDHDRALSDGDAVIGRYPAPGGGLRIYSNQGRPRLVLHPQGDSAGSNLTFTLCGPHGSASRAVISNGTALRGERVVGALPPQCQRS